MATDQIGEIERDIRNAKVVMDFGAAAQRLKTNKDFKDVVLSGYFEKEAIRLVHLKGDPSQQSPDAQKSILSQIDAIASFSGYLTAVLHSAKMAATSLASSEEELADLLNETATGAN